MLVACCIRIRRDQKISAATACSAATCQMTGKFVNPSIPSARAPFVCPSIRSPSGLPSESHSDIHERDTIYRRWSIIIVLTPHFPGLDWSAHINIISGSRRTDLTRAKKIVGLGIHCNEHEP